jgi:dolichyl-phosphate beta-glucosyltransferase
VGSVSEAFLIRIVVPCFDEGRRLDGPAFLRLGHPLLFVNDGSTDDTAEVLAELRRQAPERIEVLELGRNRGKAEAVRLGLLHALELGAEVVGYLDADLATPPAEMARLIERMAELGADVLLASRVALLGRNIQRQLARHYLGRVFASVASLVLRTPVYDTQCGAKLFRRTPALQAALATPFLSRWIFDVELLGRLMVPPPGVAALQAIVEEPLLTWHDVPGSKLGPRQMLASAADLTRVAGDLARRRRARS